MTAEIILTDEQIRQAVQCLTAEMSLDGETLHLKNVNGCIRAIEQAVLQSPEIQALRKDAERYRYLKKGNQWIVAATQTGFHVDGEELDDLIDNEMEDQE